MIAETLKAFGLFGLFGLVILAATLIGEAIEPDPPAEAASPPGAVTVQRVIDGDTVEMSTGQTVLLIGIDTPERGECGFNEAWARLKALALGRPVILHTGAQDDADDYGRLLRYVDVANTDAGAVLLTDGLAVPRYDSTDGYGEHSREDRYHDIAADPVCQAVEAQ